MRLQKTIMALFLAAFIATPVFSADLNVPPKGWKALFNGKDVTGWYGWSTKNPETLWAMSDEEQAAYKKKASKISMNTGPSKMAFLSMMDMVCT